MTACVPALVKKIALHRPLAVCFVGRVIWDRIEPVLLKMKENQSQLSEETTCSTDFSTLSPTGRRRKVKQGRSEFGLQPLKIVYSDADKGELYCLNMTD
jgi:hypothetical protein